MNLFRLLALTLVVFCTLKQAQSEELPKRLVDLMRGETLIGLKYIGESSLCIVTIVTEAEASLEQDAANLNVAELFAKYPRVEEQGNAKLVAFKEHLAAREAELPEGTRYGRAELSVSPTAGTLHKVVHVGDDYVLLETSEGDQQRKFAVNSRSIREIQWYSGPRFATSVRRLRETEIKD